MAGLTIVPRAEWGALPPRDDDTLPASSRRGVVVHWNGPKMPQPAHSGCDDLVRLIQRFHMVNKGWTDGAYSYLICQDGVVYELRGRVRYQFANGSLAPPAGTGNYSLAPSENWYTVMCLTGGDHDAAGRLVDEQLPSEAMLTALGQLTGLLRSWGAGDEVKPHRAFRVKTCPGDRLAAWCARYDGRPIRETEGDDEMSAADVATITKHATAEADRVRDEVYRMISRGQLPDRSTSAAHALVSLTAIRSQLDLVSGKVDALSGVRLAIEALGDDHDDIRADLIGIEERLTAAVAADREPPTPA